MFGYAALAANSACSDLDIDCVFSARSIGDREGGQQRQHAALSSSFHHLWPQLYTYIVRCNANAKNQSQTLHSSFVAHSCVTDLHSLVPSVSGSLNGPLLLPSRAARLFPFSAAENESKSSSLKPIQSSRTQGTRKSPDSYFLRASAGLPMSALPFFDVQAQYCSRLSSPDLRAEEVYW